MDSFTTQKLKMNPVADLLLSEHPVAYRVSFARVVSGATPALLLSQMYYWSNSKTALERTDNSFYMTQEEITEQTGLTRTETETARKKLREAGVLIEEKRGVPMKIWYRIDKDRLYALLSQHISKGADSVAIHLAENLQDAGADAASYLAGNLQDDVQERDNPTCGKPARLVAENHQDITETSTKTPSEIYTENTSTPTLTVKNEPSSVAADSAAFASQSACVVVSEYEEELVSRLVVVGVESQTASRLVQAHPERVCKQLDYLPYRDAARDKAAFVIRAVTGDWSAPAGFLDGQEASSRRAHEEQTRAETRTRVIAEQAERENQKATFATAWEALSHERRGEMERQVWKQLAQGGGPVAARAKDILRGDLKPSEVMAGNAVRAIFTAALEKMVAQDAE